MTCGSTGRSSQIRVLLIAWAASAWSWRAQTEQLSPPQRRRPDQTCPVCGGSAGWVDRPQQRRYSVRGGTGTDQPHTNRCPREDSNFRHPVWRTDPGPRQEPTDQHGRVRWAGTPEHADSPHRNPWRVRPDLCRAEDELGEPLGSLLPDPHVVRPGELSHQDVCLRCLRANTLWGSSQTGRQRISPENQEEMFVALISRRRIWRPHRPEQQFCSIVNRCGSVTGEQQELKHGARVTNDDASDLATSRSIDRALSR